MQKKISIGFYGLPRASDITFESIKKNLIEPAQKYGRVSVFYHFYSSSDKRNYDEVNLLHSNQYSYFEGFKGQLEPVDGILEKWDFKKIQRFGDAWSNNFLSLRNLILQLHSLSSVTKQILDSNPDLVVFARPDLIYFDSFEQQIEIALKEAGNIVRIPDWHWAGGYNDRFAICGRHVAQPYGMRVDKMLCYCETLKRPLHSERFLKFALDTSCAQIKLLSVRAARVRVGGLVKDEEFKKISLSRIVRWGIRNLLKKFLLRL